jgi:hypothetical protein
MGSITTYEIHIKENICTITFECEGDFGECDDGIALQFQLDEFLQKQFNLIDNRTINRTQLSLLKPLVEYKEFLVKKGENKNG